LEYSFDIQTSETRSFHEDRRPDEIKIAENRVFHDAARRSGAHQARHRISSREGPARTAFRGRTVRAAGCLLVDNAGDVFSGSRMIVKSEGPKPRTRDDPARTDRFRIFNFAADRQLTVDFQKPGPRDRLRTVELPDGSLPLPRSMSEVAGAMPSRRRRFLEKFNGGRGVLLAASGRAARRGHHTRRRRSWDSSGPRWPREWAQKCTSSTAT